MIKNVQELDQAMGQLGRMYRVLAGLHDRAFQRNPRQFAVLAEGPLDEIRQLLDEIDTFSGVYEAQAYDADVWMRLEGPRLSWPDIPVSILAAFLDAFRKGVRAVAELRAEARPDTKPKLSLQQLCDLRVATLETGSLRVGLRIPDEEVPEDLDPHFVQRAIEDYLEVVAWVGSDDPPQILEDRIGDARKTRVLLQAVRQLAPPARGRVTQVELSGRWTSEGRSVRLGPSSKQRIRAALMAVTELRDETHEGVIREIDLDKRSFTLRNEEGEVLCRFEDELTEDVKQGFDRQVRVQGERRLRTGRSSRSPLQVRQLVLGTGR